MKVKRAFAYDIKQLSGVLLGSLLGSICFVLFIKDLPNFYNFCTIKLYADHVKIYFHFKYEN